MKKLLLTTALLLCTGLCMAQGKAKSGKAPKTLPGGWKLEWNDEFDGKKLDEKKWAYEIGVVRNPGTSQSYTKDCVEVKNGKLILHTRQVNTPNPNYKEGSNNWREKNQWQPYASGSVTTHKVKHFEFGRLEIYAKVPKMSRGVWPALWTMHVNDYGWPANGEIDILEAISQEPNTCYTIFRWGKNGTNQEEKVIRTTKFNDYSKDFHLYVLEWDEEVMRVLIDDKEVGRVKVSDANYPDGKNPLKTPCYLIMNTAVGGQGTWPQEADGTGMPVQFEIDYVRYYTKAKNAKKPKKEKK